MNAICDSLLSIALIFTTQPNLIMESVVHFLLYNKLYYHHHITFAKFNLKIQHSPPYER